MNLRRIKDAESHKMRYDEAFRVWDEIGNKYIEVPNKKFIVEFDGNDLSALKLSGAPTPWKVSYDYSISEDPYTNANENLKALWEDMWEDCALEDDEENKSMYEPSIPMSDSKAVAKQFIARYGLDYSIKDAVSYYNRFINDSFYDIASFLKVLKFKSSKISDAKIADLSKEEQTDEVKVELFNLVKQFVYKYWRRYYVQYKGDLDDLVADYYIEFLTEKSKEEGKEESLLDKFDPKVTSLAYLAKIAVIRKLIDDSRKDKGERNYAEKYDEETGELSLDYLAHHLDDEDISVDDIVFDEEDILELRDKFDSLSPEEQKHFLRVYSEVKDVLSPNFKALFEDLTSGKLKTNTTSSMGEEDKNLIYEFGDALRLKKRGQLLGATFSTGTTKKVGTTVDEVKAALDKTSKYSYRPVGNSKNNFEIIEK